MPRTFAFITALALLVLASVGGSVALAADPPQATTGAAKDIGQTQATLVATVTPRGSADVGALRPRDVGAVLRAAVVVQGRRRRAPIR